MAISFHIIAAISQNSSADFSKYLLLILLVWAASSTARVDGWVELISSVSSVNTTSFVIDVIDVVDIVEGDITCVGVTCPIRDQLAGCQPITPPGACCPICGILNYHSFNRSKSRPLNLGRKFYLRCILHLNLVIDRFRPKCYSACVLWL